MTIFPLNNLCKPYIHSSAIIYVLILPQKRVVSFILPSLGITGLFQFSLLCSELEKSMLSGKPRLLSWWDRLLAYALYLSFIDISIFSICIHFTLFSSVSEYSFILFRKVLHR